MKALFKMAKKDREQGGCSLDNSNISLASSIVETGEVTMNGKSVQRQQTVKMLATFFQNPWFTRVWVLQEVWNAKSEVLVLCGRNVPIRWEEVLFANEYLGAAFFILHAGPCGLIAPWRYFKRIPGRENRSYQRMNILKLFNSVVSKGFSATDLRDKLYAILSMGK